MNPLALFAGPQGLVLKWVVIAFLAVAFGTMAWIKGDAHGTQKLIDYQAAQATAAVKSVTKQGAITERVVTKYVDRVKMLAGATTTIETEVVKYVDSKPLALACMLDAGWVRLHDDAAAGGIPNSSDGINGALPIIATASK